MEASAARQINNFVRNREVTDVSEHRKLRLRPTYCKPFVCESFDVNASPDGLK